MDLLWVGLQLVLHCHAPSEGLLLLLMPCQKQSCLESFRMTSGAFFTSYTHLVYEFKKAALITVSDWWQGWFWQGRSN
jgi:hypothetical protein